MPVRTKTFFLAKHLSAAAVELWVVPSRSIVVPVARYVAGVLDGIAGAGEVQRIELALQEAVANAVEHGSPRGGAKKGSEIRIRAGYCGGTFTCSIRDQGPGFKSSQLLKQLKSPPAADQVRGRGLFLISKIFDQVKFNTRGNEISLLKKLPRKRF